MNQPLVQNWFSVTTAADERWKQVQDRYWASYRDVMYDPPRLDQLHRTLTADRASYRHHILSWYFKLCVPMQPGECVPNSVAELLAEDWDLRTSQP